MDEPGDATPEPHDDLRDVLGMSMDDIFGATRPGHVGGHQAVAYFVLLQDNQALVGFDMAVPDSPSGIFAPVNRFFAGVESFTIAELQIIFDDFSYGAAGHETIDPPDFNPEWSHATGQYSGWAQRGGYSYNFVWNAGDTDITHVWVYR
ncbi:MAG: hypothetical protein FWE06_07850 [Oscillospiraceae bacterium]|nr:hypothetical protein [Oscillospiraceae bacterium]